MNSDEIVDQIAEFAVAKLQIGRGDVLAIKPSDKWTPEQRGYFAHAMEMWADDRDLGFTVMVLPSDCDLSVVSQDG